VWWKAYAWEASFEESVTGIRAVELEAMKSRVWLRAVQSLPHARHAHAHHGGTYTKFTVTLLSQAPTCLLASGWLSAQALVCMVLSLY